MRFVLVGAGLIGAQLVACARAKGDELVGTVDIDPDKIGRDAGEMLGIPPVGFLIVGDIAEVSAKVDVVLHATGSALVAVADQLRSCIRRKLNVVSTCEELAYPWRTHCDLATELDAEARAHGVTLLGTGINPGFVMDTLALVASVPCWTVQRVKVTRILDAAKRRASFQRKVGAGLPEDEFRRRLQRGGFGHIGLAESAWMLCDRLGLGGNRLEESIEPVLAPPAASTGGARMVAGLHQVAVVRGGDAEVVRLDLAMYVGAEDPIDIIELDANPPVRLVAEGGFPGDPGTAGVVLNAARRVCDAAPGLLTMDQLPIAYAASAEARPQPGSSPSSRWLGEYGLE